MRQLNDDLEIRVINKLFIHTQPAHLQKLSGGQLDQAHRNRERANYLHLHLKRSTGSDSSADFN